MFIWEKLFQWNTLTSLIAISGYIHPWSGRFYSLWDTGYAKIHIPIIASVSEHQPTTWVSFFFDLHILVCAFPAGVWYCIKEVNDERVFGKYQSTKKTLKCLLNLLKMQLLWVFIVSWVDCCVIVELLFWIEKVSFLCKKKWSLKRHSRIILWRILSFSSKKII